VLAAAQNAGDQTTVALLFAEDAVVIDRAPRS
jgi:ketosteroid isomerase-like protein